MILANSLWTMNGLLLVTKGTVLTERMIALIKQRGIQQIDTYYLSESVTQDAQGISNDKKSYDDVEESVKLVRNFLKSRSFIKKIATASDVEIEEKLMKLFDFIDKKPNVVKMLKELEAFDYFTFIHSFNVTVLTIIMGRKLGWDEEKLLEAGMAAMLHDIGKLDIPIEILNKEEKLTNEEFDLIKQHTRFGFERLIAEPNIPYEVALAALLHHEALDGGGYPLGVKENKITDLAKLIAVIDKFEAITGERPYRTKKIAPDEALELLYKMSYSIVDGDIVKLFRKSIVFYPVGTEVLLNTGEIGVVVEYDKEYSTRPKVIVNKTITGKTFRFPFEIDLKENLNIKIISIR